MEQKRFYLQPLSMLLERINDEELIREVEAMTREDLDNAPHDSGRASDDLVQSIRSMLDQHASSIESERTPGTSPV